MDFEAFRSQPMAVAAAARLGAEAERLIPAQLWRDIRGIGNQPEWQRAPKNLYSSKPFSFTNTTKLNSLQNQQNSPEFAPLPATLVIKPRP